MQPMAMGVNFLLSNESTMLIVTNINISGTDIRL